ncbi:hypothetical protein CROQUDRAFT_654413 [Cronartium quercuum f. sp. fusiforme G11]|uniref:Hcy-binding domain-containing protein n=1 Tax=Cronartium quercuum f. sp. fusiforme G11 TaxID=708437 RepID=A0A9P6TEG2_9BASI|nr:hypothetical protein CROQUDRAFT_654413 [Cronartium quercuum f. sp. fusiforme G11]
MSMSDLFLDKNPPKLVILDGGNGTTLTDEMGMTLDPELWSSSLLVHHPELIVRLHTDWEKAGAQIVESCSYQATLKGFENFLSKTAHRQHDLNESNELSKNPVDFQPRSALDYLRSSVTLARSSLTTAKLGLSLGPFGATLTPPQDYAGIYPSPHHQFEPLKKFHLERLLNYTTDESTWRQVDLVIFETLPNLMEIRAIRAAWSALTDALKEQYGRQEGPQWWIKPWVLSFVFAGPTGQFASGASPINVLEAALGTNDTLDIGILPRPSGVGINCTKLAFVSDIVAAWTDSPQSQCLRNLGVSSPWLWIYPDGGLVYDVETRSWAGGQIGTEEWARQVMGIAKRAQLTWPGVVVGGCCKTGPAHIRALKSMLQSSPENTC